MIPVIAFTAWEGPRRETVRRIPSSSEEVKDFVDEALGCFTNRYPSQRQPAFFYRREPEGRFPYACLRATIDHTGSYAALLWYGTGPKDGIHDRLWLSDNLEPTGDEPELIADDHTGAVYAPSSVLPLAQIVPVIHQFCLDGTGERPAGINWVTGEFNGYRHGSRTGGEPGQGA
ncbi:hypothetical protein Kpho02_77380 [Kitasatospora phosalacinea]|uniref:Uncharacterized protein n=1 Tax=Kitasatospora phosalacinea TaxID=2065 RepID=A0A9W6QIA4_9ACTN|nr:Imm1 family immunity protein [Kitasatospora phosalacinea]GLW75441.1 hypothetical protein Kpho02_77380 [Kitasatospora phosalacinea]